jgi:hypothetical protein
MKKFLLPAFVIRGIKGAACPALDAGSLTCAVDFSWQQLKSL